MGVDDDALARLNAALKAGDFEGARSGLEAFRCEGTCDPDLHLAVARLAEDAGELRRAVLEYNHALRDAPENRTALRRLANLRADLGEVERAVRCLRKLLAIDPGDQQAQLDLARLEAGDAPGGQAPAGEPSAPPASMPTEISDADAVNLCTRFGGREGVYARQWASSSDKSGYTPIHEPFTPLVAKKHLMGDVTVGVYVVRLDDTVNFLAFDLDLARFALGQASSAKAWANLQRVAQRAAVQFVDRCAELEMPAYIEDSGGKGRHVWVFFDRPISAAFALRLATIIREGAPPLPPEIALEVFPKQSRVKGSGLGNLIKIPLGIHRKTGKRCLFLNPDGSPVADQTAFLAGLQPVPYEHVLDVLSRRPSGAGNGAVQDGEGDEDRGEDPGGGPNGGVADLAHTDRPAQQRDRGAHEPLAAAGADHPVATAPYDRHKDLEYLWLLRRCPLLAQVVRKAEVTQTLTGDERMALVHTMGHLAYGPEAVNAVLSQIRPVLTAELLKSRLRGNPMGCRKIQERLPDLAATGVCKCQFEGTSYPTPLLHLLDLEAVTSASLPDDVISQLQLERLVNEVVRVRFEIARLMQLQIALEAQLRSYMAQRAVSQIDAAMGRVRLEPGAGLLFEAPMLKATAAPDASGDADATEAAGEEVQA